MSCRMLTLQYDPKFEVEFFYVFRNGLPQGSCLVPLFYFCYGIVVIVVIVMLIKPIFMETKTASLGF